MYYNQETSFLNIKIFIILVILFIWIFNIEINQSNNIIYLKDKIYKLNKQNLKLNIENDKLFQKVQLLKDDIRYLQTKIQNTKIKKNKLSNKNSTFDFKNRYYFKLLEFEGAYSNDPHDLGSETVYGITRKYDGSHKLWYVVDELKQNLQDEPFYNIDTLRNRIKESDKIQQLVYDNYEMKWKKYKLHTFPFELSSQLFDIIINCGEYTGITMLQYTLNAFNYKHQFGNDLNIDGSFGESTVQFLNNAIAEGYTSKIIDSLVSLRIYHYLKISNSNKSQRKFINGWIKRANVVY